MSRINLGKEGWLTTVTSVRYWNDQTPALLITSPRGEP